MSNVTNVTPPFPSTLKMCTQMEYLFLHAPRVAQYIIQHILHNSGDIQEWCKGLYLHIVGSGILSKPECYTIITVIILSLDPFLLFLYILTLD